MQEKGTTVTNMNSFEMRLMALSEKKKKNLLFIIISAIICDATSAAKRI